MPVRDLIGERFGRLVVIKRAARRGRHVMWRCLCSCGNRVTVYGGNLRRDGGHTTSCGCAWRDSITKHGEARHPLWGIWKGMKARCLNPRHPKYPEYGGRGIKVCKAWLNPAVFIAWGKSNGYQQGLSIDRKNNNGNYTPRNCHWATRSQQQRNRRSNRILTFRGRSMPVAAWLDEPEVRRLKIDKNILYSRLRYGWTTEQSLTMPVVRGSSLKSRIK
jgi:hypothetical protein